MFADVWNNPTVDLTAPSLAWNQTYSWLLVSVCCHWSVVSSLHCCLIVKCAERHIMQVHIENSDARDLMVHFDFTWSSDRSCVWRLRGQVQQDGAVFAPAADSSLLVSLTCKEAYRGAVSGELNNVFTMIILQGTLGFKGPLQKFATLFHE